jgi:hypothetical protein
VVLFFVRLKSLQGPSAIPIVRAALSTVKDSQERTLAAMMAAYVASLQSKGRRESAYGRETITSDMMHLQSLREEFKCIGGLGR